MITIKDDNTTRKKPIIRLLILCICTTVFLIQTTSSLNNEYIFFFGFKPASLFNPDFNMPTFYPILTIFTSMVMHGGWLHFLGNMLYLWIFADNIADRIGHKRFIFFGLISSLLSWSFSMTVGSLIGLALFMIFLLYKGLLKISHKNILGTIGLLFILSLTPLSSKLQLYAVNISNLVQNDTVYTSNIDNSIKERVFFIDTAFDLSLIHI